ncbi:MAG TPA: type II secretion system protein [Armatimonadota bacterium]|jgi:prepilin-type N-terminal cleavage/methylation domain-containing protein/prepilin-type processing-associated H-X9-DG protein
MGLRSRAGFTLIELLVVISITALLAALLFPVFGLVKERGRFAACQSNLKQISYGWEAYRSEWDGAQPMWGWDYHKGDTILRLWSLRNAIPIGSGQALRGMPQVWLCPSLRTFGDSALLYNSGYLPNEELIAPEQNVRREDVGPGVYCSADYIDEDIPAPTETILLVDKRCGGPTRYDGFSLHPDAVYFGFPPSLGPVTTHGGGRSNYLFCDGSVRSLRAIQTLSPVNLWLNQPIAERQRLEGEQLEAWVRRFRPEYQ